MRLGMGYLNFAQTNPTNYQIMFGSVLHDFSAYPDLAEAAQNAYAPVLLLMEEIIASNPGWDMTATRLGGMTWSAVQGVLYPKL